METQIWGVESSRWRCYECLVPPFCFEILPFSVMVEEEVRSGGQGSMTEVCTFTKETQLEVEWSKPDGRLMEGQADWHVNDLSGWTIPPSALPVPHFPGTDLKILFLLLWQRCYHQH